MSAEFNLMHAILRRRIERLRVNYRTTLFRIIKLLPASFETGICVDAILRVFSNFMLQLYECVIVKLRTLCTRSVFEFRKLCAGKWVRKFIDTFIFHPVPVN